MRNNRTNILILFCFGLFALIETNIIRQNKQKNISIVACAISRLVIFIYFSPHRLILFFTLYLNWWIMLVFSSYTRLLFFLRKVNLSILQLQIFALLEHHQLYHDIYYFSTCFLTYAVFCDARTSFSSILFILSFILDTYAYFFYFALPYFLHLL